MTPDPSVPPIRIETLKKYAKSIFDPVKQGESVTTVWVPMAGRRLVNKYLVAHADLFADVIGKDPSYLLVYLEPLELTEESLAGYVRLMGKSTLEACQKGIKGKDLKKLALDERIAFFSDESITYTKLLSELKSLIKEVVGIGVEVVFFLGKFDDLSFANTLFCNNLKALWEFYQPRLHYIFLVKTDITRPEMVKKCAGLVYVIMQNVIYVPLLNDEDVNYLFEREEKRLKEKFNSEERGVVREVCGPHPYLTVIGCRVLANLEDRQELTRGQLTDILLSHYNLQSAARELRELRSTKERELLREIATATVKELPGEGLKLEKLGLVRRERGTGRYVLFGKLFKTAILGEVKAAPSHIRGTPKTLTLDTETGIILLGERSVEEEFTRQEYEVLSLFLKEPNKLKTRDEISTILWGEESYEKYSDWAIDQLMSQLRRKLEQLGVSKKKLVTIRGRGYKFLRAE